MKRITRRHFVKVSSIAAAAAVPGISLANRLSKDLFADELNISIFSKPLQFLNYTDMCDAAKSIGFDGVDLTVRPKGHVLPENVESDLPKAVEAMKKYGMEPIMMSSNVSDANKGEDQLVLSTAAKLGFKYYRPAWYKYGKDVDIKEASESFSKQLRALGDYSKEKGIIGSYQNRSGHYFGAPVWDLNSALEQIDSPGMGCQYDIMHNVIEGGKSWEIDFRLIKDKINTLVIKDVKWVYKNGLWDKEYVPMGEGMVDFQWYFKLLKKYKVNVPMSIHYEYDLGGAEKGLKRALDPKEVYQKMKKDLDYVKRLWAEA